MTIRTLADVKRACRVGVRLTITDHHLLRASRPETTERVRRIIGRPRPILKVQTNAIALEGWDGPDSQPSWLRWGKADTIEPLPDGFRVLEPGFGMIMDYRIESEGAR